MTKCYGGVLASLLMLALIPTPVTAQVTVTIPQDSAIPVLASSQNTVNKQLADLQAQVKALQDKDVVHSTALEALHAGFLALEARVAALEADKPCTPVNCTLSAWGAWAPVGACVNNQQTEQRTRTITAPATCNGTCNEPLTETRVVSCGSAPVLTLAVSPTTFTVGSGTLTVTWANIPTPRTGDWLAIYSFDAPASNFPMGDFRWKYVDCLQHGSGVLAVPSGSCTFPVAGLLVGKYRVSLNAHESLTELARAEFTIAACATPVNCVWGPFEGPWVVQSDTCVGTTRTIVERQSRAVATPASCGGAACAGLPYQERTRVETCSAPIPPSGVLAPSDLTFKGFVRGDRAAGIAFSVRGAMAIRQVGSETRVFMFDDTEHGRIVEYVYPTTAPSPTLSSAPRLRLIRDWGTSYTSVMRTIGMRPYPGGMLWDAARGALCISFGEGYVPSGHDPSIACGVVNDANGTIAWHGPWRTFWHSQMTRGPFTLLSEAFANLYTGGKRVGISSFQASGNANSPFGMVLGAINLPALTAPPNEPGTSTIGIPITPLIQHGIATRQLRNTNYQTDQWNVNYDCRAGVRVVPGGNQWGGDNSGAGQEDSIFTTAFVETSNVQGVVFGGELCEGHMGYGDPFRTDGSAPKTECHGLQDPFWNTTGPFCTQREPYFWFYNPADLGRVARGEVQPWSLTPTHIVAARSLIPGMHQKYEAAIFGSSYFDPATKELRVILRRHNYEEFGPNDATFVFAVFGVR